ncbi:MAG: thiaminase II [Defluviitaleaceae bacterium]|nr:thiaminase II [Defluviitaleaceae bacterium]
MSFSRGLKAKATKVWEDGYNHPFVQELGKGTLDKEKFKFYLLQDYLYLLQYAKVFATAVLKSDTEEYMTGFSKTQHYILSGEMNVHREYMKGFGITPQEVESVKSSLYNRSYTANMLSYGLTGGLAEVLAAVFPCAWTYADYGKRLKEQYADKLDGNYYKTWIENYASNEFSDSFEWFYDALDELTANMSDEQRNKIEDIFISSVEFEYLFWDMAYKQQMSYF